MFLLKWGAAAFISFPVLKAGSTDFAATGDWTPVAADCKISKTGGVFANCANTISAIGGTGSVGWKLQLSATEMEASRIMLQIVDPAIEDQAILIETFGNASARLAFDLDLAEQLIALSAQGKLDVNAEADTALADYDAPTKAEMDTAHGLLATEAKQDIIDTVVDAIKAVTDNLPNSGALSDLAAILTDTGTTLDTKLNVIDTVVDSIQVDTDDIQARIPASLVGGAMDSDVSAIQANALDDAAVATDLDTYQAKVWMIDDDGGGNDRYMFTFFKNGKQITAGVTVPTVWVYTAAAAPADLIGTSGAPQALTEAGSTETWFHDESTNRIADGTAYFARVKFTVDGAEREWVQPIGRDN